VEDVEAVPVRPHQVEAEASASARLPARHLERAPPDDHRGRPRPQRPATASGKSAQIDRSLPSHVTG
jgi:hypothetical protein